MGLGILEREVAVAAGGGTPVGDFAFDSDVAVGALDEVADVAYELADGKDVLRGSCAEGGRVLRGVLRGVLHGRRGFDFRGVGSAEGAGLFRKDVGGGDVGRGVEERGLGCESGARGRFAGAGAAEVGQAGDVVRHRRTSLVSLRGCRKQEGSQTQQQLPRGMTGRKPPAVLIARDALKRFGGGSGLRAVGVRGGRAW